MMQNFPFDTVLFDVDGTLIDSNGAHAESWTQAFREYGIETDVSRIRVLVGMGGDKLLPAVARVSEDSAVGREIAQRKKQLFGARIAGLSPTRGARALVQYLREQQLAIVIATSADDREVSALLKQAGVDDLIPLRASKDDAASSKPDPDIVQAALRRSRTSHDRGILIGDTPYDVEAGARAGVSVIALRCGGFWSDEDLSGASVILDDPAALLDYLKSTQATR